MLCSSEPYTLCWALGPSNPFSSQTPCAPRVLTPTRCAPTHFSDIPTEKHKFKAWASLAPYNCYSCCAPSHPFPPTPFLPMGVPMGVPEVSFCKLIQSGCITAENLYMASFNYGAKSRLHSIANALTSTGLPDVISCLIKYLCPQVLLVPAMLEHLWCPVGLASGRCNLCPHIRPWA